MDILHVVQLRENSLQKVILTTKSHSASSKKLGPIFGFHFWFMTQNIKFFFYFLRTFSVHFLRLFLLPQSKLNTSDWVSFLKANIFKRSLRVTGKNKRSYLFYYLLRHFFKHVKSFLSLFVKHEKRHPKNINFSQSGFWQFHLSKIQTQKQQQQWWRKISKSKSTFAFSKLKMSRLYFMHIPVFQILISFFRYTWQKNGKPYDWQVYDDRISQQPGRGTLVITSPRDEDIGKPLGWWCPPKNALSLSAIIFRTFFSLSPNQIIMMHFSLS